MNVPGVPMLKKLVMIAQRERFGALHVPAYPPRPDGGRVWRGY